MAEFLFVCDQVAPVVGGDSAIFAASLARAIEAKHRVTIVALAAPERATNVAGLARRLRTITVRAKGQTSELPLYEGRSSVSQCALYLLGCGTLNRGRRAAFLASAASALVREDICRPDVVVGWDEASAYALCSVPVQAARSIFFVPSGTLGVPLTQEEQLELDPGDPAVALARGSLVALGAIGADVVALPNPAAAQAFGAAPELSLRASDERIISIRLGCDEPPHDPSSDPALAATFSEEEVGGKLECRRALARRASLALGPRTLLLTTGPLEVAAGGQKIIETLSRLARADVAIVIPGGGDRSLVDQANLLTMRSPGRIAILSQTTPETERQRLAGSDAILLADEADQTGRAAGLALRYGTLPLSPYRGASAEYLVDYDVASTTGCGLLYDSSSPWEGEAVVQRAINLRANADVWRSLLRSVLIAVPRWAATAAALEAVCISPQSGE
jgi:hypothetical protein